MKNTLLLIGLVTGLAGSLRAGETLHLKVEPERDSLLLGSPQELVLRIENEVQHEYSLL